MKLGTCRLCMQTAPLLNKSHIIPDFFYDQAGLYNEKHKIHKFKIQNNKIDKKASFIPTGVNEGGLLCKECDNILIGGLELYGRKVLFGGLKEYEEIKGTNYKNPKDGFEYSIIENVDYRKFKLFLLSILWRSKISNNPVFKEVSFSIEYTEYLRTMIIEGNPGKYNDFPIITMSYLKDQTIPPDLIGQPIKSETSERILITYLLAGFIFIFVICPNYQEFDRINNITPTENNKFGIMHIPQGQAWKFIMRYTNMIAI